MNVELIFAWLLDILFGDPASLPHPVVFMGRWIAYWERRLNRGNLRWLKGAAFALSSIVLTYFFFDAFLHVLSYLAWHVPADSWLSHPALHYTLVGISYLFRAFLMFFCLAGCTLRREVRMVFEALDRSLDEGRRQVARIVGRDTQELSAQEVRTAALETLAENLSDGVVAPLFWYALLGLPGMLAYKMVNTLDSMIGYHTPRYKEFGCWAARIDDIANFLPARITALLMLISGWLVSIVVSGVGKVQNVFRSQFIHSLLRDWEGLLSPGRISSPAEGGLLSPDEELSANFQPFSFIYILRFTLRFGPQHASPNSGWPEAALASMLDCRFGGAHNYFGQVFEKPHIGHNPRLLTSSDVRCSLLVTFMAELLFVFLLLMLSCT